MATTTSVTDVLRNFSDYINRVAYRGERFVLTRGGREVAELIPAPAAGRRLADLPEILASLPTLGEDEAVRFAHELEEMRRGDGAALPEGPWES
jgi:prevent-host-death family protein